MGASPGPRPAASSTAAACHTWSSTAASRAKCSPRTAGGRSWQRQICGWAGMSSSWRAREWATICQGAAGPAGTAQGSHSRRREGVAAAGASPRWQCGVSRWHSGGDRGQAAAGSCGGGSSRSSGIANLYAGVHEQNRRAGCASAAGSRRPSRERPTCRSTRGSCWQGCRRGREPEADWAGTAACELQARPAEHHPGLLRPGGRCRSEEQPSVRAPHAGH